MLTVGIEKNVLKKTNIENSFLKQIRLITLVRLKTHYKFIGATQNSLLPH